MQHEIHWRSRLAPTHEGDSANRGLTGNGFGRRHPSSVTDPCSARPAMVKVRAVVWESVRVFSANRRRRNPGTAQAKDRRRINNLESDACPPTRVGRIHRRARSHKHHRCNLSGTKGQMGPRRYSRRVGPIAFIHLNDCSGERHGPTHPLHATMSPRVPAWWTSPAGTCR